MKFYSALGKVEVKCFQDQPDAVKQENISEASVVNTSPSDSTLSNPELSQEQSDPHNEQIEGNDIVQEKEIDMTNAEVILEDAALCESAFDLSEFLILNVDQPPAIEENGLIEDISTVESPEQALIIPTIQLTSNSASALEHSMPIATQYLSTNNPQQNINELIPLKKHVRVVIRRLSTSTIQQFMDLETNEQSERENLPNKNLNRRSRSISRKSSQLQDVNRNVMKRETKRASFSAMVPKIKRMKMNDSEANIPKTIDEQLLAQFNIKPCSVIVKKIIIENGSKSKTPPSKSRKNSSKNKLKIKLAPKGKKKVDSKVLMKERSKSVPLPFIIKTEPVLPTMNSQSKTISQRSVSVPKSLNKVSPNLIITEELSDTLVLTEAFSEAVLESQQQLQEQSEKMRFKYLQQIIELFHSIFS